MTTAVPAKREIVLDTETTGLDSGAGHRIVEIGCLEVIGFVPTGEHFAPDDPEASYLPGAPRFE